MIDGSHVTATDKLDLYVIASGPAEARSVSIGELVGMFPLDVALISALELGERVLLRPDVARADAEMMSMHLESIGFLVELSPHRGGPTSSTPPAVSARPFASSSSSSPLFDIGAGLVGLDGDEEPESPPRPTVREVAIAAPAASIEARVEITRAAPRSRFGPDDVQGGPLEIGLDRPAPEPSAFASSTSSADVPATPVPRCPTHDAPLRAGLCSRCESEQAELRGRMFGGRLRAIPTQRILIGVGGGLLIGWILTAPISRRTALRVTDLREQAARERARPTEEGQAQASRLDSEADDQAQSSDIRTYGVWGLIAAAVTAGWMRLT